MNKVRHISAISATTVEGPTPKRANRAKEPAYGTSASLEASAICRVIRDFFPRFRVAPSVANAPPFAPVGPLHGDVTKSLPSPRHAGCNTHYAMRPAVADTKTRYVRRAQAILDLHCSISIRSL